MEYPKNAKIEAVAAGYQCSPWLQGTRLMATNGHIAAVLRVETAGTDTDGYIPEAAFKAARHGSRTLDAVGFMGVNGGIEIDGKDGAVTMERPEDHATPPSIEAVTKMATKGEIEYQIALDAKLLAKLAAGLATEKVILTFRTPKDAVVVETFGESEHYGLIMPCVGDGFEDNGNPTV